MKPIVFLIGAGPGDPELLTLRGERCLRQSDVVLYDGLSNAEILTFAPDAEHICVGKHGQSRIWKQQEIIDEMLRHAVAGRTVSRLKGGDPAVFARTAEEVAALDAAGIDYEIVPGITAALAAGSYAGIPITHRKLASAVALVTGHEEPGKAESAIDWDALARFPGTLVVYMGVTTARTWTEALIRGGKDPGTATALVRRCSLSDQAIIRCRLDEVAEQLTPASRFRPPVIAIVGEVAALADVESHRVRRPLKDQTILVTRPIDQADSLADAIRRLGGRPVISPTIEIKPLDDYEEFDRAIAALTDTDLLIFCSTNGVEHFFRRLKELGKDARHLAGTRVAVVGQRTMEKLSEFCIRADFVPDSYRASGLIELLRPLISDGDSNLKSDQAISKICIVRANRGSDELPKNLQQAGATVQEIVAYQNVDVDIADPAVAESLAQRKIDWVTVTSSATAKNLVRLYGDLLNHARLAAISPVTASTLTELGLAVDAVADPHTTDELLNEIVKLS